MKLGVLGATGRTGRLIVEQALSEGHHVRALVRDPAKVDIQHERLEVLTGDPTDAQSVRALAAGRDAVISALGPGSGRKDVCGTAAANVVAAEVKRYVTISGAGVDVPGDQKDVPGRIVSFMVRTLTPAIFQDKVVEHQRLAQSPVGWTLVRPPRLTDKPATGRPKTSLQRSPGSQVSRADLAAFVLACAQDDAMIRKAPFVAS